MLTCLGVWQHMKAGCFANISKKNSVFPLWVKMSSFQNTYLHQHSVKIHKRDIHQ